MNKHNVLTNAFCRLFEERCISIMDSMYQEDSQHAIDLMDDEAVVWGIHSSPLTFAYENFMYDVVAHTCSQKYINIKWYNNLAPDLVPFLQVDTTRISIKTITPHSPPPPQKKNLQINRCSPKKLCFQICNINTVFIQH